MSVRQRLYPEPGQKAGLVEHCHHARFVFNIGLEQRSMWRRDKHNRGTHPEHGNLDAARVNTSTQMRELAQLRGDLDWLRAGSSSVQQAALRDLDRAFANFYAGRAKYPQFKRRTEREGSFVVRDLTVRRLNRKWGLVTVPKVGTVRFRISRLWAEIEAATSAEQARFVRLQQQLSRQEKGSQRRAQTMDRLAVLRRRLEDRRTDWVEQTTTDLARTYDLLAVEDLQVRNMVRRPAPKPDTDREGVFLPNGARAKASLNRAILASVWGRFLTRLEHKMPEGHVVRVDPKNTSRTCAACGHCASGNRESQAVFECVACGHAAHADTNAAVIILARGLDTAALNSTVAAGHAVSGRPSPALAGSANQPAA